jgi:hypothetical protein
MGYLKIWGFPGRLLNLSMARGADLGVIRCAVARSSAVLQSNWRVLMELKPCGPIIALKHIRRLVVRSFMISEDPLSVQAHC